MRVVSRIQSPEKIEEVARRRFGYGAAQIAAGLQQQRHKARISRIEMMRGYAETQQCRRQYLLQYFGEDYPGGCGNCDRCLEGRRREPARGYHPFPVKSWVVHKEWGRGVVERYEGNRIVVLFPTVGTKTLALNTVRDNHLLEGA